MKCHLILLDPIHTRNPGMVTLDLKFSPWQLFSTLSISPVIFSLTLNSTNRSYFITSLTLKVVSRWIYSTNKLRPVWFLFLDNRLLNAYSVHILLLYHKFRRAPHLLQPKPLLCILCSTPGAVSYNFSRDQTPYTTISLLCFACYLYTTYLFWPPIYRRCVREAAHHFQTNLLAVQLRYTLPILAFYDSGVQTRRSLVVRRDICCMLK